MILMGRLGISRGEICCCLEFATRSVNQACLQDGEVPERATKLFAYLRATEPPRIIPSMTSNMLPASRETTI